MKTGPCFDLFRLQRNQQIFCATALAIFALCTATASPAQQPAQQPPLQTIRVLCLNRPLPVVAALEQGIYAKLGMDVQFIVVPSSEALRNDLANGIGDVAFIAADNAVAMVDSGADAVIVMGGESSVNELIVQPEIKSVRALRGRVVLVDAPNTAYALQLQKILLMNGLHAQKDYEMKPIGSTAFRLQAMKDDKEYAASIMNPPFSILAKHAGLVSLGSMQKLLGADQDRATFAMRPWAQEHADLLARYLVGYIRGQRWLMAPSNKAQVVALVMKESNLTEPIAREWYAAEVQAGGYARDARFDALGFRKNLRLRAEIEGAKNARTPALEKYVDFSYYRAALSKLR